MADEQRVALVTGAARGIGAATVGRLSASGIRVLAVDACAGADHQWPGVNYPLADRAELDQVAAGAPDRVIAHVADVTDRDALRRAADVAVTTWGRLDIAVAAAAVMSGGQPLWETPEPEVDLAFQVTARGVWNTAAATIPHLLDSPGLPDTRFVAVASAAGERGLFRLPAYVMAKHAVVGIVRALAADLVGTPVTATAITPGPTRTAMLAATGEIYGVSADDLAQSQLLRTVLDPTEIAETIWWCTTPAGRALHGSVVHAEGGFGG